MDGGSRAYPELRSFLKAKGSTLIIVKYTTSKKKVIRFVYHCGRPVLRIRIRFDPGSGMGKNQDGSGMTIPDHISGSLETIPNPGT
jgi:hypothetical protein